MSALTIAGIIFLVIILLTEIIVYIMYQKKTIQEQNKKILIPFLFSESDLENGISFPPTSGPLSCGPDEEVHIHNAIYEVYDPLMECTVSPVTGGTQNTYCGPYKYDESGSKQLGNGVVFPGADQGVVPGVPSGQYGCQIRNVTVYMNELLKGGILSAAQLSLGAGIGGPPCNTPTSSKYNDDVTNLPDHSTEYVGNKSPTQTPVNRGYVLHGVYSIKPKIQNST